MRARVLVLMLLALGFAMPGLLPGRALAQQQSSAEARATKDAAKDQDAAYKLPPEKLARAIAYSRARVVLGFVETGWGLAVLAGLLAFGAAARMRDAAVRTGKNRWVQGYSFTFLLLVVTALLELPLDMYGHHLSLAYGQSVQRWGSWFGDQGKSFALSLVFGGLFVMLLFFVIRKSPTRWWFWFWIPAMAAVVLGVFVTPVFIDPLFNKFEPLQKSDPALVERLETVVKRGGMEIAPDRMFLMKASEKVTGLNAYVTGIGASKRVVVWDTSIAKATPDEISFIFGHEMGHYVMNHIWKTMLFLGVLLLVEFYVGYRGMRWLIARFGGAWRVPGQADWSALVVLMLVLSVLSFFTDPIVNGYSRMHEHEADVYGQEAIHGIVADPQRTAQQAFQVLGEEGLVDPHPNAFVEFWTFSHPSIGRRAAFAAAYDPWVPGQQPRYFKR